MTHSVQALLAPQAQMQIQQHLQSVSLPPASVQPAAKKVRVLPPPVHVTVAQPKPVQKSRPREKQIFVVADHQRCIMSNLASLWKSGKLCDAGIGNGLATVMVSLFLKKSKDIIQISHIAILFFFFYLLQYGLVLWHINHCRLFNAKSIFIQISKVGDFCQGWFKGSLFNSYYTKV